MQVYNVEIFDKDFDYIYHDLIDATGLKYTEDYISYGKNSINIYQNDSVKEGDFISISDENDRYFGVIKTVEKGDDKDMTVSYAPFISLFDIPILFDTNLQGSGQALENVIESFIEDYRKNNEDSTQNIPVIGEITCTSSTTQWGFNIKSDKEGMHRCICNFYGSIITRAFTKYGIVINCTPDMSAKKVNISIGSIDNDIVTIETSLKTILSTDILIGHLKADINKLIVYNGDDYSEYRTYYLHPDGEYDRVNDNRIEPVKPRLAMVDPDDTGEGTSEETGRTFEELADSEAASTFSGAEFENNISLELMPDNSQFTPKTLPFGQQVRIIHNGASYKSIVSKKEISSTIKLTFGTIRVELTNLLKGGYFNG